MTIRTYPHPLPHGKGVRNLAAAALAGAALLAVPALGTSSKPVAPSKTSAVKPVMAQNFTLTGADGVKHSLTDYRGRTVALFFFCGCQWCHEVAGQWSTMQRAGALPKKDDGNDPVTVIVFSGDASGAEQFERETALDQSSTVMLTDLDMNVTLSPAYNAEPCPRVFVIDPTGRITYTNNHKDDAARQASGVVIATRALNAVLAIGASTKKSS